MDHLSLKNNQFKANGKQQLIPRSSLNQLTRSGTGIRLAKHSHEWRVNKKMKNKKQNHGNRLLSYAYFPNLCVAVKEYNVTLI